jgi:imidazolonepropionase-like amidohydrolase
LSLRTRLLALAALPLLPAATPAAARVPVIHAGRLIDGVSANAWSNVSIVIKDDRIVRVENGFVTPTGAEMITLSSKTVLPGFIDTHDHISMGPVWSVAGCFTHNQADQVVTGMRNARRDIETGFTTIRDCGSGTIEAPALSRAIAAKQIVGPRIWSALQPLSATGGHSDAQNGMQPNVHLGERDAAIIDSAEDARREVRAHHRHFAALVKIMPSGGVGSIGDDPHHMTITDEEMRSVAETAHELGMKVAAHTYGKKAIDHAIVAGVDSIDHGSYADAESYALMKKHGTFLCGAVCERRPTHDLMLSSRSSG